MIYKKPQRLKKGDKIAIVSPSWGGPSVFPEVYENGLKVLREWGLEIVEYPTARADASFLKSNPKARADDLNKAFSDPEIKAIFTSIGGIDSARILRYLNRSIIANNPKILIGYSDTTTLHVYLSLLGITSFYSPSIMAGFSQMENLPAEFKSHVYEMLFEPKEYYDYHAYKKYCDGYPNWTEKGNLGKVNTLKDNDGWHWLQGTKDARGQLFGGCVEVLEMIKGSDFWPNREFWKGKVLFLETSEEKPSLHYIDHVLRNYGILGVFDQIEGLIFSRARDYSDSEKKELEEMIVSIVAGEFGRSDIPIVANFDVGHTDPQLVLPLGVMLEISPKVKTVRLVEQWLQ